MSPLMQIINQSPHLEMATYMLPGQTFHIHEPPNLLRCSIWYTQTKKKQLKVMFSAIKKKQRLIQILGLVWVRDILSPYSCPQELQ